MRKIVLVGLLFVLCPLSIVHSPLLAQTKDKTIQAGVGVGAGFNPPVRFDIDLSGEYFLNDTYSIGADFDIFVRGRTAYNFLGFGRYHFELSDFEKFEPYVGAGVGGLVNSAGRGWFDLMLPELGFLYELSPHLLVGPNTSFHILAGSGTTWDWQLLGQIIYRF